MNIALLNTRITIQQQTTTVDTIGNHINTWQDYYTCAATVSGETKDIVYTVKKGDTLWDIAKKYLGSGARYTEIVKLNGLKTSVIIVGQKLKIPTE